MLPPIRSQPLEAPEIALEEEESGKAVI
jgi:hypothetical protein